MLALYALLMQAIPRGDDPRQVLMPVIAWWDGDTGLGWILIDPRSSSQGSSSWFIYDALVREESVHEAIVCYN